MSWVRFPYNPIHLLCMQESYTFCHKYFDKNRVETCMHNKCKGLDGNFTTACTETTLYQYDWFP